MCTALTLKSGDMYFGRTLDLDCSYGEEICVLPRGYRLKFSETETPDACYAMIGMALVIDGVPLFYDAANEHGLCAAGLNFPGNACYMPSAAEKTNIAPFELIPWVLCRAKSISEVRELLSNANITDTRFSEAWPNNPLHWIISSRDGSIAVEPMQDGVRIYDAPLGVMTNNPPYELQMFNLNNYRAISSDNGENRFSRGLELDEYCAGLGGLGLPGDLSSMSRFVRIAYAHENSVSEADELSSVGQFFHLLSYVGMPRGLCRAANGQWDITVYTSCINADRGRYYYTTYNNRRISLVDMYNTDIDGNSLIRFKLKTDEDIFRQN